MSNLHKTADVTVSEERMVLVPASKLAELMDCAMNGALAAERVNHSAEYWVLCHLMHGLQKLTNG